MGLIILQVEFILTMITIEKAVLMSHKWLYIEGFIQCTWCKGQFLNKLNIYGTYSDHFLWITCLCYTDIECHPPPFKNTITYTFYIQIIFLYHDTMQAEMASKITTQKSFNTHSIYFLLPNFSQLYIPSLLDPVSVLLHYYW